MPISTVNQKGLDAPLTLTSPVLTTPNLGTPSALVLTNATGLGYAAMPTGSVLQVVQGTTGTSSSTTSTSYQQSVLTVSITPKFSTSKIFVLFTTATVQVTTGQSSLLTVYRNNSTNLGGGINTALTAYENSGPSGYQWVPAAGSVLDTPATTSSTSYTLYFKNSGVGTAIVNWATSASMITLMEIAG